MRSKVALCIAVVSLAAGAALPARAANWLYVSGPAEQFRGYTVPVLVINQGDTVTYANFDIDRHDVVSTAMSPTRTVECDLAGRLTCPRFWTPLIGIGETSPVYGISAMPPGQFPFICTAHAGMKGTLVVL